MKNTFLKLLFLSIAITTYKTNGMVPAALHYKRIIIKEIAKEPSDNVIVLGILLETNDLFLFRSIPNFTTDNTFAKTGCLIFSDSRYTSLDPQSVTIENDGKIVTTYLTNDNSQVKHRFHSDGNLDGSYQPQHAKFFIIKNQLQALYQP